MHYNTAQTHCLSVCSRLLTRQICYRSLTPELRPRSRLGNPYSQQLRDHAHMAQKQRRARAETEPASAVSPGDVPAV